MESRVAHTVLALPLTPVPVASARRDSNSLSHFNSQQILKEEVDPDLLGLETFSGRTLLVH
jgi:hypothetical protein